MSKVLVGAAVGAVLGLLSLVAAHQSSDLLHYITAAVYLSSPFFAHLPASRMAGTRCAIREGVFLYLATTFIAWIVAFNLMYAALKAP